jgi:hypothetical protein
MKKIKKFFFSFITYTPIQDEDEGRFACLHAFLHSNLRNEHMKGSGKEHDNSIFSVFSFIADFVGNNGK